MKVDEQRRKIDFYKYSQSRNSSENNHEFFYSKFKNYANAFFLNKKTNNFENNFNNNLKKVLEKEHPGSPIFPCKNISYHPKRNHFFSEKSHQSVVTDNFQKPNFLFLQKRPLPKFSKVKNEAKIESPSFMSTNPSSQYIRSRLFANHQIEDPVQGKGAFKERESPFDVGWKKDDFGSRTGNLFDPIRTFQTVSMIREIDHPRMSDKDFRNKIRRFCKDLTK